MGVIQTAQKNQLMVLLYNIYYVFPCRLRRSMLILQRDRLAYRPTHGNVHKFFNARG